MISSHVSRASAAFLIAGAVAMGCSHAWDVLEPLPGGSTSASSGMGGATTTSATSATSAQGTGGATSSSDASSTSVAVSSSDASSSSDAASSSDASSGTGGGVPTAQYPATFAACNSDQDLSLANCEVLAGRGGMYTDLLSDTGFPMHAYMRFDLDGQLAGKTIDAVTLRLTTLPNNAADSDHSGEIWQVVPFDTASLALGQPATIGGAIAADLGPVALATDYYWDLPMGLVAADSSVFLAVITTSDDGVRYWNHQGMTPPRLIIAYH